MSGCFNCWMRMCDESDVNKTGEELFHQKHEVIDEVEPDKMSETEDLSIKI